uniref:Glycosyltransferase n=1 Tax=Ananas comosus var. bracteatus TaxID=296719 RepID=A0A6V7NKF2_ANACO|nr:unnamed protein product [Ananas comosus var. bracteatus]
MGHPDSSSVYSEHDNIAPGGTNTGAAMSVRQCSRTARCSARQHPRAAWSSDRLSINIYVNNNIQGVANSVLLGSKVAMQDPRLRLSYQQLGGGSGDDSDVETEKHGLLKQGPRLSTTRSDVPVHGTRPHNPLPLLAKLLIQRHPTLTVTFLNTPLTIQKLIISSSSDGGSGSDGRLRFVALPFDAASHGLPAGSDNTDSLPHPLILALMHASSSLAPHFDSLLPSLSPAAPPSSPTSSSPGPSPSPAATAPTPPSPPAAPTAPPPTPPSGCTSPTAAHTQTHTPGKKNSTSPDFPTPSGSRPTSSRGRHRRLVDIHPAEHSGVNAVAVDDLQHRRGARAGGAEDPTGGDGDAEDTDDRAAAAAGRGGGGGGVRRAVGKGGGGGAEECGEWLRRHPPASVLYVSFGSQNAIAAPQMRALAAGIEAAGVPFVWVVRPPFGSADVNGELREEWLPDGFAARMAENCRGEAVGTAAGDPVAPVDGAFLSHCGWNSTLESLSRGVPIIGWPLASEQFYNSKMLEEELEVCVELARGVESAVESAEMERVIRAVIGGKKGKEMRRRAETCAEIIRAAMREVEGEGGEKKKGSSLRAIDEFIEEVVSQSQMQGMENVVRSEKSALDAMD